MDHVGCLNYTIRCPVGVGESSARRASSIRIIIVHSRALVYLWVKHTLCRPVCSRSDQPLEFPSVPADLEDCTCPGRRQHGGGKAQRDDLCDGLDDVQADAAGRYDRKGAQSNRSALTHRSQMNSLINYGAQI